MSHSEVDTGSSSPHWGEKEHTASVHVPLMTGTMPSQNPEILASEGNLASYVQVDGNGNIPSVLTG